MMIVLLLVLNDCWCNLLSQRAVETSQQDAQSQIDLQLRLLPVYNNRYVLRIEVVDTLVVCDGPSCYELQLPMISTTIGMCCVLKWFTL